MHSTSVTLACATRMGRSEGGSLNCIALLNLYCTTPFIQDVNPMNSESQEALSERNRPTYFIEYLNLKFIKNINLK